MVFTWFVQVHMMLIIPRLRVGADVGVIRVRSGGCMGGLFMPECLLDRSLVHD